MSGELYWLASYPKSGNTWMRVLLTNYFSGLLGGSEPADINNIGHTIASSRDVFDENVGIEASDLTQDEIENLRPLVYEQVSSRLSKARLAGDIVHPVFLKVHDAYTRTPEGSPLIPKNATAGAVYLVRNPLDVAVSFAHHAMVSHEQIVARMASPAESFVGDPDRLYNQLRQRLLTWSDHVRSWLDEPGLRVITTRYEDLSEDPAGALGDVLEFAGVEVDAEAVATAVEYSSFDRLRAQEQQHGFRERPTQSPSFFRRGVAGAWRDELADNLVERIRADHHDVMRRLGYG